VAVSVAGVDSAAEVADSAEEAPRDGGSKMQAENYFTAEEKERIKQAVDAAEERTSGEIVPMIVTACRPYAEIELGGLAAGLALGTLAALFLHDPWGPIQTQLSLPLIAGTLGYILCRIPAIKRRLIPKARIDDALHTRSLAAFTAHGLHYTRAHTGILIFAALFEHRVEVLADRGINEKVQAGTWQEVVDILTAGLKSNNGCAAFCAAIERCGDILATHFPRPPDDRDELKDELVTEK
jgi:putative membrane protein